MSGVSHNSQQCKEVSRICWEKSLYKMNLWCTCNRRQEFKLKTWEFGTISQLLLQVRWGILRKNTSLSPHLLFCLSLLKNLYVKLNFVCYSVAFKSYCCFFVVVAVFSPVYLLLCFEYNLQKSKTVYSNPNLCFMMNC